MNLFRIQQAGGKLSRWTIVHFKGLSDLAQFSHVLGKADGFGKHNGFFVIRFVVKTNFRAGEHERYEIELSENEARAFVDFIQREFRYRRKIKAAR